MSSAGGGSTFSPQSEGATSQVNDAGNDWLIQMIVAMIGCVDSDDCGNDKKVTFPVQSATTS